MVHQKPLGIAWFLDAGKRRGFGRKSLRVLVWFVSASGYEVTSAPEPSPLWPDTTELPDRMISAIK